jgi:hypothetical protein
MNRAGNRDRTDDPDYKSIALAVESLRQIFARSKIASIRTKLGTESELLRSVFRKRLHFG